MKIIEYLITSVTAVLFLLFGGTVSAQPEGGPTIENMHLLLENAARQANSQISNTRLDDNTTLKIVTYDRGVPVMTYFYTSNALQASGAHELTSEAKKAMMDYHRIKTCSTQFSPFMRVFGLKVSHRFEDAKTGIEIITITVTGKDCAGS